MSIFIFFVVLFVLILVHELGHFTAAKFFRMRVDEFGIGFPPRLTGIRKGETEYTLNALPLGGFVRILGEDAVDIAQGDSAYERSFTAKSKSAQALVLCAGVAMNILLAWFLFVLVLALGTSTSVSEAEAGTGAGLVVTDVIKGSPAADAGIPAGAHVTGLSADGAMLDTLTPSAFQQFVVVHAGAQMSVHYQQKGVEHTVKVTPERYVVPDDKSQEAIGISLSLIEIVRKPLPTALYDGTKLTVSVLHDVSVGIASLLYDAVRFRADFSQIAGPVGIVGLVGEASAFGLSTLLMFTAFISLNLAVINLLPFPALDGGRLLFVLIEAVKGSPVNPHWVARLNTAGFALLILLMVAVTFNDVAKLI